MILHSLSCGERMGTETSRSWPFDNSSNDSTALMLYNTIHNSLLLMLLSHLYIIKNDLVYVVVVTQSYYT